MPVYNILYTYSPATVVYNVYHVWRDDEEIKTFSSLDNNNNNNNNIKCTYIYNNDDDASATSDDDNIMM